MNITFEKKKGSGKNNPLVGLLVVIVFVALVVWMLLSGPDPIPDTNGPDDYSLTTITDENILNLDMGAINPIKKKGISLDLGSVTVGSGLEFSSRNFTGVYEVMYNNYFLDSDVVIELNYLKVNSGNFRMVVVYNGEIIETIEPSDEPIEFRMEDVNGTVSLRIAGESADYEFSMFEHDYDMFAHS